MPPARRVQLAAIGFTLALGATGCGSAASTPSSAATDGGYRPPVIALSTDAGDPIASVDVVPEAAATVEGTGSDGAVYRLEIPAFALHEPATISVRPLAPVAVSGGRLVAGVELEPEGTTFAVPLKLTITPPSGSTGLLVPFQYSGTAEAGVASLAAVAGVDSQSVVVWLGHFSGAFIATPTDQQSFDNWSKAGPRPTNGTPADVKAWAEAVIDAAAYDVAAGRSPDPAASQQVIDDARSAWVAAEAEVWANDQAELAAKAKDGNLADADEFKSERDAITAKAMTVEKTASEGGTGDPGAEALIQSILSVTDTYLRNVGKNLDADPAFQRTLQSGSVDGMLELLEIGRLAFSADRQDQLLGRVGGASELSAKVQKWLKQYGLSLAASCLVAPIAPAIALGISRESGLLGLDDVASAMVDCEKAGELAFPPPKPTKTLGPCTPDNPSVLCGPSLPISSLGDPIVAHGTVTGHFAGRDPTRGATDTVDVTISADMRWNLGFDYEGLNAITLIAGRVEGSASSTADSDGCVLSATLRGDLVAVDYQLETPDFNVSLAIPLTPDLAPGGAGVRTVARGGLVVRGNCRSGPLDYLVIVPQCDLVLKVTSRGVLDGSCEANGATWKGHFGP